ncbi:hypothetical protein M231_06628 [Tremella mesenterica]|uniref:Uncharacterized protein n=1 Tax=Tremella mesenterica TaxID=5217 RepID=A0A4Q1BD92_TREME|nr:hypothetical protein M231_06628 [Tremella mesenterica]
MTIRSYSLLSLSPYPSGGTSGKKPSVIIKQGDRLAVDEFESEALVFYPGSNSWESASRPIYKVSSIFNTSPNRLKAMYTASSEFGQIGRIYCSDNSRVNGINEKSWGTDKHAKRINQACEVVLSQSKWYRVEEVKGDFISLVPIQEPSECNVVRPWELAKDVGHKQILPLLRSSQSKSIPISEGKLHVISINRLSMLTRMAPHSKETSAWSSRGTNDSGTDVSSSRT